MRPTLTNRGLAALLVTLLVSSGCYTVHHATGGTSGPARCTVRLPILYLDMDGTTLDSNHRIRPETLPALQLFRECGGLVGLASGRTLDQVRPYLDELKPNLPLVLYNGAVTLTPDGRSALAQASLNQDSVQRLLDAISDLQSHSEQFSAVVAQYADGTTLGEISIKGTESVLGSLGIVTDAMCPLRDCTLAKAMRGERSWPAKIMAVVPSDRADAVSATISKALGGTARAFVSDPRAAAVEVVPVETNKAIAIERAVLARGYTLSNVVAFGDSQNDVEMLARSGMGIAMANCHPRACESALFMTGSNDSDAISRVILRFLVVRN
jgi:Cof subfamily protein (haloacid dehalogenase superfamily)